MIFHLKPTEKILDTAIQEKVDVIGLSGLITPSLEVMVEVAKEMERRKMNLPLMIGGATTSRIHTAVKIAPHYSGAVIHVLDASRSVPVVSNLVNQDDNVRKVFEEKIKTEYAKLREDHLKKREEKNYLSLEDARKNKFKCDWREAQITVPKKHGVTVLENYPLDILRKYIDWTPFFQTWEM
ncbi:MAG: methionine synthase, partial [Ignavibacteria bacterium]|nr:methionine synthase [Ignavibacteria bacterium]